MRRVHASRSGVARRRGVAFSAGLSGLVLCAVAFCRTAAAEPAESALRLLWERHAVTNAVDHEALLAECQAFSQQYASHPLAAAGQSMAAWNLLRLGRPSEAAPLLTAQLARTGTPLENGASYLARSWLTRLDRERIKAALQFYYRREVRYPASIDELLAYPPLPAELAPPARDRWDGKWRYSLVGFRSLAGLLDQQYEISALRLGGGSDLAAALAVPYGALISVRPLRVLSGAPGSEIVEWVITAPPAAAAAGTAKPAERTVALGVNATAEGIGIAYIGRTILVVYDTYHWKLLDRPDAK